MDGELPIGDSDTPSASPGYAKNQAVLAELIGRDRKTIQRWLKIEGNPGHTADGRYPIEEWKEWIDKSGRRHGKKEKENKLDIETKIAAGKLEMQDIELAKMRGELLHVDEVVSVMSALFGGLVSNLRTLRHNIAPQVVGETVPEATKRLGNAHDGLLQDLSLGDWAKKKYSGRESPSSSPPSRQSLSLRLVCP